MTDIHYSPVPSSLAEIKTRAMAIAAEMKSGGLNPDLRKRFIEVRAALFRRGVFDPVLVRFDSATVPPATTEEIADQLAAVAASL